MIINTNNVEFNEKIDMHNLKTQSKLECFSNAYKKTCSQISFKFIIGETDIYFTQSC